MEKTFLSLKREERFLLTRGVLHLRVHGGLPKKGVPVVAVSREKCAFFVTMGCRNEDLKACVPGQSVHLMMP